MSRQREQSVRYLLGDLRAAVASKFDERESNLPFLVGPGVLWLLCLLLVPITFVFVVSLTETSETYQIIWTPTLANYVELLGLETPAPFWQSTFVDTLLYSYFVALSTTFLDLVLAFPVAYLLVRSRRRIVNVVFFFVLLPFFTMFLVRAYSWFLFFGPHGIINNVLVSLGLVSNPVGIFNYGTFGIVVALVHGLFPYMLLTLFASLDGVDFTLVEAARDLGASRIEAFRDIVFPLVLPGVIGGSLFVFVPSFGAFVAPRFLGQGKVLMIGQLIEQRITSLYQIGYGSAVSVFIIVTIAAAFLIMNRYVSVDNLGGA